MDSPRFIVLYGCMAPDSQLRLNFVIYLKLSIHNALSFKRGQYFPSLIVWFNQLCFKVVQSILFQRCADLSSRLLRNITEFVVSILLYHFVQHCLFIFPLLGDSFLCSILNTFFDVESGIIELQVSAFSGSLAALFLVMCIRLVLMKKKRPKNLPGAPAASKIGFGLS